MFALALLAESVAIAQTADETIPWGVERIHAPEAWAMSTGAGVKVAVLDFGIDNDHMDLNVAGGVSCVSATSSWDDTDGHGTMCAGVIAALRNDKGIIGVAPDVQLYAVKVASHVDQSDDQYVRDLVEGIQWCIDNDIDVISISAAPPDSSKLKAICDKAARAGIVIVASAGNNEGPIGFPAAYDSVIAVSAVDMNDKICSYSHGPQMWVCAPGQGITTTTKDGGWKSEFAGSSAAAPHVAGVVALIKQLHPEYNVWQVKWLLAFTSTKINQNSWDDRYGHGLVNAAAVVATARLDSKVVGQGSPDNVRGGQEVTATVTMKNTGSIQWGDDFTLCGINNDAALLSKGDPIVSISKGTYVGSSETYTFKIPLYVKSTIPDGTYNLKYQMRVKRNGELFGEIVTIPVTVDNKPPIVVSYAPTGNNVLLKPEIKVTFNEPVMRPDNAQMFIRESMTWYPVAGHVESVYGSVTAKFVPDSDLKPFTAYSVIVTGVKDAAGNTMEGYSSWQFTTTSDVTPPAVLHAYPGDGDVNVPLNVAFAIRMTEALDPSSVDKYTVTVQDGSNHLVNGAVSYEEKWGDYLIYFIPDGSLSPGVTYTVTLCDARDLIGNVMAPCKWSFTTTTDFTAPSTLLLVDVSQTNGWYNCDPLIQFVPQDPDDDPNAVSTYYTLDGVAYVYKDVFYVSGDGEHTLAYNSVDPAGNVGPKETFVVRIDTVKPAVSISTPMKGSTYTLGDQVLADWSVTDDRSGVDSATGTYENGKAIDTGTVGEKEFTVTATDNAGNTETVTVNYYVA